MIGPYFEELSEDPAFKDKIIFVKVDVDAHAVSDGDSQGQHGVMSLASVYQHMHA